MSNNLYSSFYETKDGHGGRAEEHRAEMEEIARRIFAEELEKLMPELERIIYENSIQAYQQALRDVLGALEYDIESVVQIGFNGCRDIYIDKKTQKYISDHIMKEITKRLKNSLQ